MVTQSKSLAAAVPGGSSNLIRPRRAASCSNALTLAMYEAMTAALEGANVDDSVHCVLVAGVPGAFSAGKAIHVKLHTT
jgi:enoyl-CoA hydratase/carnithine racemase